MGNRAQCRDEERRVMIPMCVEETHIAVSTYTQVGMKASMGDCAAYDRSPCAFAS